MKKSITVGLVVVFVFGMQYADAQDPKRFEQEIKKYIDENASTYKKGETIVFTGSSSIRMWKSLPDDFSKYKVINRGFGGSQMSDLYYYRQDLIIKYQPKQIFIYEGDNDIAHGKSPRRIMKDYKKIVKKIRKALPDVEIVFISPKPSIARWHLNKNYVKFNKKLKKYCKKKSYLKFIDVWSPMINDEGTVMKDIFINDGLHLNAKGYKIWVEAIRPFLME